MGKCLITLIEIVLYFYHIFKQSILTILIIPTLLNAFCHSIKPGEFFPKTFGPYVIIFFKRIKMFKLFYRNQEVLDVAVMPMGRTQYNILAQLVFLGFIGITYGPKVLGKNSPGPTE